MTTPDYIAEGIQDAATRHSGSMSEHEVAQKYRQIQARPIGEVRPYVAPEDEKPDTGALNPSQVRALKMFAGLSGTVSFCAAFIQQAATGAFNQYFGWAILAAAGVFVVSGVSSAVSGNYSGNTTSSNSSNSGGGWHFGKKEEHHHYHQYNQQGPNNQQTNIP